MAANTPGTPSWLGAVNDRAGLSVLLDHGPLTRNRICELVGVSKPTASQMMSRLLQLGAIEEQGLLAGSAGRAAVVYAARTDRRVGVALDLDAFELRATVVDAAGSERPMVRTPLPRDPTARSAVEEVRRAIDAASEAAGTSPDAVHTVCLGIPGYVDPGATGELFSETLPGWPVRGLRAILEGDLGRTVLIENDVNLAALAEREFGAAVGSDVFALLWLGNGVGASFDVAGDLHRGSFGGAGEIGFLPVSAEAAALDPAARTVQDLVGGRAVALLAQRHGIEADGFHAAREALADPDAADARRAVFDDLAERVAHIALPVIATLDPGLIVLAGPTANLGGEAFAQAVAGGIRRISRWYPEVRATSVEGDAVLRGARSLLGTRVREELLDSVAALGRA
ncbi:Sugar kinase of the NBD/HSP70 family, may contain an N-terminal HTH domain [Agromyces sp. CF514]|uniref:ROK family transcriptional regulator n=1 Tax=Agromyces sp. CF514 TaxID=1881031 RepID=UPI0008EE31EB|nr:ROK family transcriptional regulator [Agromyces sp. CF514]SFR87093.1 Sugar kinase of the NBD/HSP70 family, may contain an N-terminal HTH domain [Agromyces sp. CF514]